MISKAESMLYVRLSKYKRRLDRARNVISDILQRVKNPYVAFSTGKDSTCVLHLVLEQTSNISIVYFDADCAFPESIELLELYKKKGLRIIKWKTEPLLETFKKHGLDNPKIEDITMQTTVYTPIKTLLKHYNFDCVFVGLRAGEGRGRSLLIKSRGDTFFNKRDGITECLPVAWWTEEDIWGYIHSQNIPYNKAYDYGLERVSYWAGETKMSAGRWVTLKRFWPDLFNKFASIFPEARNYV